MSNEMIPPEQDLDLIQALQELRTKREPWYLDRWLIASLSAIGGAIFMYVARQPEIDHYKNGSVRPPVTRSARQQIPDVKETEPEPTLPKDAKAKTAAVTTAPANGATAATDADAEAVKDAPAQKPKAEPKPDISGSVSGHPMDPLGGGDIGFMRDAGGLPAVGQPGLPAPDVALDTLHGLTISGSGGEGAVTVLTGIAKKFGGGLKKYEEYTGRDQSSSGYIVWVPEKNSRPFLDKLKSANGIDISEEQEGSSDSRNKILTEGLRTLLAKLTKQRADLLIKYYDDAPSVREVDSQIAEVNKSLSSMRTPGAGYAVAKIEIG